VVTTCLLAAYPAMVPSISYLPTVATCLLPAVATCLLPAVTVYLPWLYLHALVPSISYLPYLAA